MKASCRIFFFFFFGYHAPAVWQCVVYHDRERERETQRWGEREEKRRGWCLPGDAENKCTVGGVSRRGGREGGNVTCPRFSSH